jgi:hypothetical protein
MTGEGAWGRRAFLDLGYLVRNQTMRFAVYGLGRFFVGSFYEAEDLSRSLVEPVPVVFHPVLFLDLFVSSVGVGYGVSGQPFHSLVVVHKHRHRASPPIPDAPHRSASRLF